MTTKARTSRTPRPSTSVPTDTIVLTPDGRRLLEERLAMLNDVSLPLLRPLLVRRERDERDVAEFERLSTEARWLDRILGAAVTVADVETQSVQWGTRVRVEIVDGESVWIRPVHPVEAFLDDERVSITSPVSQAILGARVGDRVEVDGPGGTWTCRILEIEGGAKVSERRRSRRSVAA
jgi:transcription elongation GreA/GreB family factor